MATVEDLSIERVVNTHSHEDHIGANGALQARRSVEVLAHAKALRILADPRLLRLQPYREETGERVRELHQKGLSQGQIRKEVFGREMPIACITLGHFSGRNLVRSYLENYFI